MKSIYFYFLFVISVSISAQEKITEVDLKNYLNQQVTYCDKVFGTFVTKGEKQIVLLNLGADYPDAKLVVAIFQENWKHFDYKPEEFLKDKTVCVKGKLVLYKDTPQIVVKKQGQITVKDL